MRSRIPYLHSSLSALSCPSMCRLRIRCHLSTHNTEKWWWSLWLDAVAQKWFTDTRPFGCFFCPSASFAPATSTRIAEDTNNGDGGSSEPNEFFIGLPTILWTVIKPLNNVRICFSAAAAVNFVTNTLQCAGCAGGDTKIGVESTYVMCFQIVQHLRGRKNWLDRAAFVCAGAARGSFSSSSGVLDNFAMRIESFMNRTLLSCFKSSCAPPVPCLHLSVFIVCPTQDVAVIKWTDFLSQGMNKFYGQCVS